MKISPKKRYQLLPSTQTQQKAIKGIVNASLFALSSYSSVSATSIQRELQVAFPPSCLTRIKKRKAKGFTRHHQHCRMLKSILTQTSAKPQHGWEASVYLCWGHQLRVGFHLLSPLSLELSPAKVMKNNSVYYNICLRKLNSAPTVGRRHRA